MTGKLIVLFSSLLFPAPVFSREHIYTPLALRDAGDAMGAGRLAHGNPVRGWGYVIPPWLEERRMHPPLSRYLPQAASAEEPFTAEGPYLFTYFLQNGQDGLHIAHSDDGLSWKELESCRGRIVPKVGKDRLMRDPFVLQGPDGVFHMVWTVSWREKGIGYASSVDLIHWSEQRYLPVMEHEPQARNCWAPEIVYDAEERRYVVFWATTIPGRFPKTDGQNSRGPDDPGLNHRIYYVTSRDMKSFSETRLFFDQGFNVIDATIVKDGPRYVMFLKDETNQPFTPQKNIRWTVSDRAEGPYRPVSAPITGNYWCEGPSALKMGGTWVVYFDRYRENRYGAVVSHDLMEWKDISDRVSFPANARHGAVLRVSREFLAGLLELK